MHGSGSTLIYREIPGSSPGQANVLGLERIFDGIMLKLHRDRPEGIFVSRGLELW